MKISKRASRIGSLAGGLVLCTAAWGSLLIDGIYEPGIANDSPYYRQLVAKPLPASTREKSIAYNMLATVPGSEEGGAFLRYVESQAVAKALGGPPVADAATIADAIAQGRRLPALRQDLDLIQGAVRATVVPGDALHATLNVENLRPVSIRHVVGKVLLHPAIPNVYITCQAREPARVIQPSATESLPCWIVLPNSRVGEEVHGALEAAASDPSRSTFKITLLEFDDPPLLYSGEPLARGWLDRDGAHFEALRRLESVSCLQRGACLLDLRTHVAVINEGVYFVIILLGLAFAAGSAVGRFAQDWWRAMKRIFIGLCLVLAAVAGLPALFAGGWGPFWALYASTVGMVSIVIFMAAMAPGVLVGRRLRNQRSA